MIKHWQIQIRDPKADRRRKVLLIILLLIVPLAFYAGLQWAGNPEMLSKALQQEQEKNTVYEQEVELLQQRMAVLRSAEKVAQQANEQSRQTIKLLENQVFDLQQELGLYKGVLAPGSQKEGLNIRAFELQKVERGDDFRYKILLNRMGKGESLLEGSLHVMVEGEQDGKTVKLDLISLSQELNGEPISFSFKHFQSIPAGGRFGILHLPEGFVPGQIRVRADIKNDKPVERIFKWAEQK